MSSFKPKRVSGTELYGQIAETTSHMPAVVPMQPPAPSATAKAPATVQINFKATEGLANLIAAEALKAGSTRRFIARLMRDAGYAVPDADLNPPDTRKRGKGA